MRSNEHGPQIEYDGDCWVMHCLCGKYLGGYETAEEAGDAFEDHMGAINDR